MGWLFPPQCEKAAEAVPSTPHLCSVLCSHDPSLNPGLYVYNNNNKLTIIVITIEGLPLRRAYLDYLRPWQTNKITQCKYTLHVVGGLGFEFCMFVTGWRHALRSEWPFIIIFIKYTLQQIVCAAGSRQQARSVLASIRMRKQTASHTAVYGYAYRVAWHRSYRRAVLLFTCTTQSKYMKLTPPAICAEACIRAPPHADCVNP